MKGAPKILCVEEYTAVRESRCAVLKASGYDVASASPQVAEAVLRGQRFDLIVFSMMSDEDRDRLLSLTDGAQVLVLDFLTLPKDLLTLVAERLNRIQQRA